MEPSTTSGGFFGPVLQFLIQFLEEVAPKSITDLLFISFVSSVSLFLVLWAFDIGPFKKKA